MELLHKSKFFVNVHDFLPNELDCLQVLKVPMGHLFSEQILDQELWVLEGLQLQWSMGGMCQCALWIEDIYAPLEA